MNMLSPYRIQPNINNKRLKKASNTNIDNKSLCEYENKRSQRTSKDLKLPQMITKLNPLKVKTI